MKKLLNLIKNKKSIIAICLVFISLVFVSIQTYLELESIKDELQHDIAQVIDLTNKNNDLEAKNKELQLNYSNLVDQSNQSAQICSVGVSILQRVDNLYQELQTEIIAYDQVVLNSCIYDPNSSFTYQYGMVYSQISRTMADYQKLVDELTNLAE